MATTSNIKIGDTVPWAQVPDRSMWRHKCGAYEVRHGGMMQVLNGTAVTEWDADADEPCVTIVALGLTGRETADDLRRLAEVYEVREATFTLDEFEMPADLAHVLEELAEEDDAAARVLLARCLHAAGWRPGMTAEDAARLLSAC